MTVKLIGAALLVAGGAAAGFGAERELARRRRFLAETASAARRMGEEIAARALPLPELLAYFEETRLAGPFFSHVRAECLRAPERPAEEHWETALAAAIPAFRLDAEDADALRRVGEGLGRLRRDEQLARLAAAADALASREQAAAERIAKYGRLARFGGFGAGVCLALLLW